jgi:hypothetical protein
MWGPAPQVVLLGIFLPLGVDKSGNPVRLEETILFTAPDTKKL